MKVCCLSADWLRKRGFGSASGLLGAIRSAEFGRNFSRRVDAATGRAHNGPRDATSVARSVGRLEPLCRRAGTLTNGGGFGGLKRSAGLKRVGGFYFVSNTGSNTLSSLRIDDGGQPALANAVAANTHPGPDRSSFERPFPLRPDWAHEHGGRVPRRL